MITVIYTIGRRNIYLTLPGHFVIVCGTNRGDRQKLSQKTDFVSRSRLRSASYAGQARLPAEFISRSVSEG